MRHIFYNSLILLIYFLITNYFRSTFPVNETFGFQLFYFLSYFLLLFLQILLVNLDGKQTLKNGSIRILILWIIMIFLFSSAGFIFKISEDFSRLFIGFSMITIVPINILVFYLFINVLKLLDLNTIKNIILIGENEISKDLVKILKQNSQFKIVKIFKEFDYKSIQEIDKTMILSKILIFSDKSDISYFKALSNDLSTSYADILFFNSHIHEFLDKKIKTQFMSIDCFSFDIRHHEISSLKRFLKRFFDFTISLFLIIILLPFFLLIAFLIKMDSSGPVIYKQLRHGLNGKEFSIFKFRSMYLHDDKFIQAKEKDKRITRVGTLIRKLSIDELPQLLNVLIGEMSLVGPRPHVIEQNLEYSKKIHNYMSRHRFRPGITGLAQINGFRGPTDDDSLMHRRIDYDLEYIDNWSIFLDIKILFLTPFSLISHRAF